MALLSPPAGTTRQHRGLRSYHWSAGQTLMLALLLLINWVLLAFAYDWIQGFWHAVLAWGWPRLGIGAAGAVAPEQVTFLGQAWQVVSVQLQASPPTTYNALIALVVLAIVFLLTVFVPRRHLPWIYLVRALVVLCAMSALAFLWIPALFHPEISGYFNDLLKIGSIFLWLVPLVHALLLYIFPLATLEKFLATWIAIGFLALSVPLHVGALAWIVVHTSTLAMLPIYMLATFLPPILGQLGIYAYFMSRARVSERRGVPRPKI